MSDRSLHWPTVESNSENPSRNFADLCVLCGKISLKQLTAKSAKSRKGTACILETLVEEFFVPIRVVSWIVRLG